MCFRCTGGLGADTSKGQVAELSLAAIWTNRHFSYTWRAFLLYNCSKSALREIHSGCCSLCASFCFKKWHIWCLFGPHNLETNTASYFHLSYFTWGTCPLALTSFTPLCRPGDDHRSLVWHRCFHNCQKKVAFHKIVFFPFCCTWVLVINRNTNPSNNALDRVHLWISPSSVSAITSDPVVLEVFELYPICANSFLRKRAGNDAWVPGWEWSLSTWL